MFFFQPRHASIPHPRHGQFKVRPWLEELESRAVPSVTQPVITLNAAEIATAQVSRSATPQQATVVGAPLAPFAVTLAPASPVGGNGAPTLPQPSVPPASLPVSLGAVANPTLLAESPILAQMAASVRLSGGTSEDFTAGPPNPGGRNNLLPVRQAAYQKNASPAVATTAPRNRPATLARATRPAMTPARAILDLLLVQPRRSTQPTAQPDQNSRHAAPRQDESMTPKKHRTDLVAALAGLAPVLGFFWSDYREDMKRRERRVR